jgi:hypothetical protein
MGWPLVPEFILEPNANQNFAVRYDTENRITDNGSELTPAKLMYKFGGISLFLMEPCV